MATYRVTNNADSGQGSLRRAVLDANANLGLDTIIFEVIDVSLNSAILITDSVEITGNGTVITQTGSDRLFNISDDSDDSLINVTFNNLTLTGGRGDRFAGAINTLENLTLNKITVEDNVTSERGGAVLSNGATLVVNDSLFRNNRLTEDNENAEGGAIYLSDGTLEIIDSGFEENEAKLGIIRADNSNTTISNSSVNNNQGLAILTSDESTLSINKSEISANSDGGIVLENNSKLTLTKSSVINNQAQFGAGITLATASEAEIINSIISSNIAALDGGGIKVDGGSKLSVTNGTIFGNNAPIGSGIYLSEDSDAFLLDTNVAENTGSDNQLEGANFSIETTPVIAPEEANFLQADVHRFYQYEKGFHLYTSDANEIAVIQEQSAAGTLSYNYEAEKFTVLADNKDTLTGAIIAGAKPVYRFFNTETGSHLYTMDEIERGFIEDNLANYNFEDIQYYAFEDQPENIETVPVYRMLNSQSGSHLFTIDQAEVNYIQDNLPNFSFEGDDGIAFHVFELS